MKARALMVQGTASHVGKSLLCAALCRIFARAGRRVAPFKAQNMSLNAVVALGGEMGAAQALQARACFLEPRVEMNPVLLKPAGPEGCHRILLGQPAGKLAYASPARAEAETIAAIRAACAGLSAEYELLIIEGAGSPAEINRLDRDLANMFMAREADARVLLVGDIDRGGVFASLLGTWMLAPEADRIRGFVINKMRGDPRVLASGLDALRRKTGVPTLGIIPFADPALPEEDAAALSEAAANQAADGSLRILVLRLPHIANFTDFDALAREPGVHLEYAFTAAALRRADVIILPGTRATVADLRALRAAGLDRELLAAAARGKPVLGICGGYQMLGREIHDPSSVESSQPLTPGLNLLPVTTHFLAAKNLGQVTGCHAVSRLPVAGFFLQHGRIMLDSGQPPWILLEDSAPEGCQVGRIAGASLHQMLNGEAELASFRQALLAEWRAACGKPAPAASAAVPSALSLDQRLDAWADHVRRHLDMAAIEKLAYGNDGTD